MPKAFRWFATFLACLACAHLLAPAVQAQPPAGRSQAPEHIPTIEERTAAMRKVDGYFPLYWDERTGNLWLEIARLDDDFLLATGVAAGLGSNDIGLDRGLEDSGKIVSFQRVGPKVLLVQGNASFRSSSPNLAERRSVEDSFAKSVLWGFTVGAESNGRVLVDATDYFIRDGSDAGNTLSGGVAYKIDRSRSAVYAPRTKAFPKNTEIEVTLTFTNEPSGGRGGGGFAPTQGPPPIRIPAPGAGAGIGGARGGPGFGGGLPP
ncbi:MAG TPA: DUF5117 domain-containing protein, partial [Bryobacteraceae bacterium]|nr:DUF5117 domain-containing protein [Bryobacteraceae bacterium]